jgi:hypothetical protein
VLDNTGVFFPYTRTECTPENAIQIMDEGPVIAVLLSLIMINVNIFVHTIHVIKVYCVFLDCEIIFHNMN